MRKKLAFWKMAVMLIFALGILCSPMGQTMAIAKEPVVLKSWVFGVPETIEIWRILGEDLKKLGIQTDIKTGALSEWVGEIIKRDHNYHLVTMIWGAGPDRLEPSFFLTGFYHSQQAKPGGRNYGNYINKEYDQVIDEQIKEMDKEKRQKLVRKAQEIIARDNVFFGVYHRDYIQAYNTERIEGVVPTIGSGIGFPYAPWTFLMASPKSKVTEPRIVGKHDLVTLNPFAVSQGQNEGWLRLAYDTFVKRDQNTELIPWAAESWKISDDTTIEMVLRKGMKFHDGRPVTVKDVKFTFEYIKKWKFPALSQVWRNIDRIDIMEGNRIQFKLFKPYAPFAENILLRAFIAPKHIWEKIPDTVGVTNPQDWTNPNPVGSGPYTFAEWKKGEYFHLKANKAHWMAPKFNGLYYIVIPSIENQMAMLEKGQAEILGWYVDLKQGKKLEKFSHLKMVSVPGHGIHDIRPNVKLKPLNDPEFRRAVQHAIDRRKMLDIIYGGRGTVCRNTPISPLIKFWNNPDIPMKDFDLDKAREILKSAGYTWDSNGRLCYP